MGKKEHILSMRVDDSTYKYFNNIEESKSDHLKKMVDYAKFKGDAVKMSRKEVLKLLHAEYMKLYKEAEINVQKAIEEKDHKKELVLEIETELQELDNVTSAKPREITMELDYAVSRFYRTKYRIENSRDRLIPPEFDETRYILHLAEQYDIDPTILKQEIDDYEMNPERERIIKESVENEASVQSADEVVERKETKEAVEEWR